MIVVSINPYQRQSYTVCVYLRCFQLWKGAIGIRFHYVVETHFTWGIELYSKGQRLSGFEQPTLDAGSGDFHTGLRAILELYSEIFISRSFFYHSRWGIA